MLGDWSSYITYDKGTMQLKYYVHDDPLSAITTSREQAKRETWNVSLFSRALTTWKQTISDWFRKYNAFHLFPKM